GPELRPRGAAVGRPENCAAHSAAIESPTFALPLVHGREDHFGILRIHHQVDRAGILVAIEHLLPRLPTIDRLVDAPLRIRSPQMTDGGNPHRLRIRWMDEDLPDVPCLLKSCFLPGASAV